MIRLSREPRSGMLPTGVRRTTTSSRWAWPSYHLTITLTPEQEFRAGAKLCKRARLNSDETKQTTIRSEKFLHPQLSTGHSHIAAQLISKFSRNIPRGRTGDPFIYQGGNNRYSETI